MLLAGCGYFSDDPADESSDPTVSPETAAVEDCVLHSAEWVDLLTADRSAYNSLTYSLGIRHPMYRIIETATTLWHQEAVQNGSGAAADAVLDYLRDKCEMTYGSGSTAPTVPSPP